MENGQNHAAEGQCTPEGLALPRIVDVEGYDEVCPLYENRTLCPEIIECTRGIHPGRIWLKFVGQGVRDVWREHFCEGFYDGCPVYRRMMQKAQQLVRLWAEDGVQWDG